MSDASGSRPFILPAKLKGGDRIRFVSPASTPDRDRAVFLAGKLQEFGFVVDFGRHAFEKYGPFAGTDEQRLADLNDAYRDPTVRAIFATRGGKGSYRIADRLDFEAIRHDPKPLLGFSDITALHLAIFHHVSVVGLHGALYAEDGLEPDNIALLLRLLSGSGTARFHVSPDALTTGLTCGGTASGPLIGGNLETIVVIAGWALPDLTGAILLLEAVDCKPGGVDRALTSLRKAGHLDRIAGFAIGQFIAAEPAGADVIIEIVRDHLRRIDVPVLGGLPFGHGARALTVPVGSTATIDATKGTLDVLY
jgi:muramoyltetrapeptide carboxypeptidase